MIVWRLCEDLKGLAEGSCISEVKYKEWYYTERCFFEPLTEEDKKQMIEVKDKEYCDKRGLEGLWFWSQDEVDIFKQKIGKNAIAG